MWPNPQFPADLVTFTEETTIENFIFCVVSFQIKSISNPIYSNTVM